MIKRLLNQSASLQKRLSSTSPDPHDVNYATGVTFICRGQSYSDVFSNDDYRDNDVEIELWCLPDLLVEEDDLVIYESIKYLVDKIKIKRGYDGSVHHQKLMLKRHRHGEA